MGKNIIKIDAEKCIGCGACVKDCPAFYIELKNGKAVSGGTGCIECAHCYCVCPVKAITMVGYDETGCDEFGKMSDIDSDKLLLAMKSRRTVRQYKSTPVELDKIEKILEAGRYCPTAKNAQNVAFTVLRRDVMDEVEKEAVKLFRGAIDTGAKFVSGLKKYNIDDHFFFKGAPLVIIVSSSSTNDAALASSYMEIMAESLGLGVLYSGFFIAASKLNPKIRMKLGLPRGHKAVNCMIMGYPDVEFRRIAPRKKLKVNYK